MLNSLNELATNMFARCPTTHIEYGDLVYYESYIASNSMVEGFGIGMVIYRDTEQDTLGIRVVNLATNKTHFVTLGSTHYINDIVIKLGEPDGILTASVLFEQLQK